MAAKKQLIKVKVHRLLGSNAEETGCDVAVKEGTKVSLLAQLCSDDQSFIGIEFERGAKNVSAKFEIPSDYLGTAFETRGIQALRKIMGSEISYSCAAVPWELQVFLKLPLLNGSDQEFGKARFDRKELTDFLRFLDS